MKIQFLEPSSYGFWSLTCSQIWLIPHVEDHHCGYITKSGKKKRKKPRIPNRHVPDTGRKRFILGSLPSPIDSSFLFFHSFSFRSFHFILSSFHSFIHSSFLSFIHSIFVPLIHSFFVHSFIASFIRSFFLSFCFFPDG
jgi:hypothetical protein